MAEDLNSLLDQLRQRNQAQESISALRRQQENMTGFANSLPQGGTIGGQTYQGNIGGRSFSIPTEQKVDWGSILGRFGANYMAARAGKKADDLQAQQNDLSQQFFASTMRDDPQAQKLFMMHQAGVPGADKALAQHLAPKKEALAGLIQGISSGNISPEMAAELAPRYDLDPNVVSGAASYAVQAKEKQADQKFEQQKALKMMGISAADARQSRALAAKGGKGSRISIGDGMSEENESFNEDMTPGERQMRGKEMAALDKDIMKGEQQIQKFNGLRGMIENDDTFGAKQKVADTLTKLPFTILQQAGTAMRNKGAMLLEDYLNSETLTRMAQLGGNDSNEELNRMRASLPQVMNNKEAALHLMDQLNQWQIDTKKALEAKRADYASGRYFKVGKQRPDYYKEASKDDPTNKPAPSAPTKRRSFDDIFNEVSK